MSVQTSERTNEHNNNITKVSHGIVVIQHSSVKIKDNTKSFFFFFFALLRCRCDVREGEGARFVWNKLTERAFVCLFLSFVRSHVRISFRSFAFLRSYFHTHTCFLSFALFRFCFFALSSALLCSALLLVAFQKCTYSRDYTG